MAPIEDFIRPHWVRGLNDVTGSQRNSIQDWICAKQFQVYQQVGQNAFELDFVDVTEILEAYASDCNRFSMAAVESAISIKQLVGFPKSTAWLMVSSYYGAFYAGHSILRMLGYSCSQLNSLETSTIEAIADLFSMLNGGKIPNGFFEVRLDTSQKKAYFQRLGAGKGGTHELFWEVFQREVRRISSALLSQPGTSPHAQAVAAKLDELAVNLSFGGQTKGSWLSFIRNNVNYRQEYGVWYPYSGLSKSSSEELFSRHEKWLDDPMNINLAFGPGKDIHRFHATCMFLISLARVLSIDMAYRNSQGKSFLTYGPVRMLKLLAAS